MRKDLHHKPLTKIPVRAQVVKDFVPISVQFNYFKLIQGLYSRSKKILFIPIQIIVNK